MQFSTAAALTIFSALASAAPAIREEAVVSKAANVAQWTMESFLRVCNYPLLTQCDWAFDINTNDGQAKTHCHFITVAEGSTPAHQTPQRGAQCGVYTVTSGWSGQFAEGFTTLSVINYPAGLIVFPAYTDNQLNSGTPVKPDQSYPVQKL